MERFTDEALVLSCVDYGDADRLVTLLTKAHGRLTAFAAGARKSKRRFAGALEAGTWLSARLVERRGDTLRLDGVDVLQSFFRLREDLPRIARAMYCLELCRELTRDREPQEALFAQLKGYLTLLDDAQAGPTSLLKFELDALERSGFRPRFDSCALCGEEPGARPRFDAGHGGVLCEACAGHVPGAVALQAEVARALAALQDGARTPLPAEVRARARTLLNGFIAHQLGRRLRAVDFMEQVGVD